MASAMASTTRRAMSASRSQVAGKAVVAPVRRRTAPLRASALQTRAMLRQFPDPEFIAQVKAAFPDQGIADPDEARVLLSLGYTWVDVRPALEYDDAGKVKGSVNVPFMISTKKFEGEGLEKKKVFVKTPNTDFINLIKRKFPKTDHPIMIGCSDGKTYSIDALMALDDAGYTNLVGVQGGYYNWYRVFDYNQRRRNLGEYQEKYDGEGGESCGIHASGAGFDRVDKVDSWGPPKY